MERIETLNQRLIDHFGIDVVTGDPIWKIVWSEDQFEKRLTKYTKEGLELLNAEVRELPKYKQWIHNKYILERLVIIPEGTTKELTVNATSYEPIFVFENNAGEPLPPNWNVCKFVIDTVLAAIHKTSGLARYKDPAIDPEYREQQLAELEESLFGNETEDADALAYKQGVIVPNNYQKEN